MIVRVALGLLAFVYAAAPAALADEFRLTVLHTNDMHARFDETGRDSAGTCKPSDDDSCTGYGGFARLRTALDAQRALAAADNAPAIYLYAGDTFFGTPFYDVLGWEPSADFIGDLGIDAMCLGNHEFENGPEGLAPFLKSKNISGIPILGANINTEEEPSLTNIRPSTVLTVGDRAVGVIGYLTPDTAYTNNLGKVKITDEIESLKTEVAKLKNRGVEIIIALGHSGLDMDKRIAREVDGIDAVVGGHSHSYLFSGTTPQDIEQPVGPYPVIEKRGDQIVPVVQAYGFTKYLGKLILTFNSESRLINAVGEPILLDNTIPQDALILEKVKLYKKLLAKKDVNEFIGSTKVTLDGNCKCAECNMANLITNSFIHFNLKNLLTSKVSLNGWTDAAAAVILSGSIHSSINMAENQGKIYSNDIKQILPYKSTLCKITITGETLLKALEHSAFTYDYTNCAIPEKNIYGGFMHMTGIHVTYDMKKAVGSRVQSVMIRCSNCKVPSYEPLNPNSQYVIITSTYVAGGGDQYEMIRKGIINMVDLNTTESEALEMYIKEMSPVYAEVDNRIKIFN